MQTMDFAKSIAKYAPIGRQYFELIPQRSIQISLFPKECTYNAIWDYNVSPEGRHYFPLCAENSVSGFVRLYEYLPDTGEFKLCFNLEDVVVTYPRNVRASKIHTSIDFLPDGRLIMTTHTTAAAPTHPYWLFFGYYSHPWEGYSGSNVLIYDPKTGKVEDLGIPVQRDSIYGACYDKTRNALYFNSYLRGHSYRMDLDNRHVTDYGQTTIQGSFYLKHGRDGNIYTTTRDGYFFRFNTQKQNLEDLGIQIPYGRSLNCNMMPHAADGPDGRMYVFNLTNAYLHTYDYDNNTLESMGCIVPDELWDDGWCYMHGGCGFDKYGVLWYVLSIRAEEENYLTLPHLCSLNVAKSGAKPRDMGAIGTREVVGRSCSEAHIYGDTFFMTFTNHGNDAPGMIRIDLEAIREDCDQPRIVGNDPYLYIGFSNGFDLYNGNLFTDGQPCYDSIAKSKEFGNVINLRK